MTAPQLGHLWITSLTESMQKGMRQQPSTRPNRHSTTHSRMHMAPGWYTVLVETVAWHAGHTHIIDLCCRGEREIETGKKKHRRISRSDNKLRAKDHVTRERRRHGCWCRRDVCRRLLICRGLLVRRRLLVRLRHDCLLRDAVNIVFHRCGRSRIGHQRLGCVVRSDARHRVESRVFNVSLVQDLRREEMKGRRKEEAKGVNPVREKKKKTEKKGAHTLGTIESAVTGQLLTHVSHAVQSSTRSCLNRATPSFISKSDSGHTWTHVSHPTHFSVSTTGSEGKHRRGVNTVEGCEST